MTRKPERTVEAVRTACRILGLLEDRDGAVSRIWHKTWTRRRAPFTVNPSPLRKAEYLLKRGSTYHLSLKHFKLGEFV